MIILQQMIIFLIMMIVGLIARKCGMITTDNQKQLSAIVVNIANPAMILTGAMSATEKMQGKELFFAFGIAVGLSMLMIIIAQFLPALLRYPKQSRNVINMMLVFSNISFMGMPMISGIYGNQAVIYVTLFLIPFNVLFYTYGIQTISVNKREGSKFDFSKMINPGVIACIIAIILYFVNLSVPYVISKSIIMVSGLTGPLGMMLIGASWLDINFKELLTDVQLIIFTLLKMIVLPVVILLVLKQFVDNKVLLGVCLVMLATPAGNMIAMFASQHDEKNFMHATKGISLTTVFSVITLPIVSLLTGICK
jgi:malate permease and related proteins